MKAKFEPTLRLMPDRHTRETVSSQFRGAQLQTADTVECLTQAQYLEMSQASEENTFATVETQAAVKTDFLIIIFIQL